MEVKDRVVIVTGAGRGIGAAMCRTFAEAGCMAVVVSDRDETAALDVAKQIGPQAVANRCDVANELDIQLLITNTITQFGRVDIFCSNAGITVKGGLESSNDDWQKMWDVNVMSRLFAARAIVPHMQARGEGYLIHTASAAGLLMEIGSASYSVTKHADVAMAEWLSVCYGRSGIRVSVVCPLGVETDMLDDSDPIHRYLHLHSITADDAARSVLEGIQKEEFLILPQAQVAELFAMKTDNYDRWIRGFQRLRQKLTRDQNTV